AGRRVRRGHRHGLRRRRLPGDQGAPARGVGHPRPENAAGRRVPGRARSDREKSRRATGGSLPVNPKSETNPNIKTPNDQVTHFVSEFGFSSFVLVSDFEIRISDLLAKPTYFTTSTGPWSSQWSPCGWCRWPPTR